MKDIDNNSLFTDLTEEEELAVQGGGLLAATLAIGAGGAAFANWASKSGNGFILWDNKNSWDDRGRVGKDMPQDLPYGWKWGIRDGGGWVAGGSGGTGSWLLDQAKRRVGL